MAFFSFEDFFTKFVKLLKQYIHFALVDQTPFSELRVNCD